MIDYHSFTNILVVPAKHMMWYVAQQQWPNGCVFLFFSPFLCYYALTLQQLRHCQAEKSSILCVHQNFFWDMMMVGPGSRYITNLRSTFFSRLKEYVEKRLKGLGLKWAFWAARPVLEKTQSIMNNELLQRAMFFFHFFVGKNQIFTFFFKSQVPHQKVALNKSEF